MANRLSSHDISRLIPIAEAAKRLRGRSGPPSINTLRIWANPKQGCRPLGKDGPCIVLWTVRINGDLMTLPEAVEEFDRARVAATERGGTPCRT